MNERCRWTRTSDPAASEGGKGSQAKLRVNNQVSKLQERLKANKSDHLYPQTEVYRGEREAGECRPSPMMLHGMAGLEVLVYASAKSSLYGAPTGCQALSHM